MRAEAPGILPTHRASLYRPACSADYIKTARSRRMTSRSIENQRCTPAHCNDSWLPAGRNRESQPSASSIDRFGPLVRTQHLETQRLPLELCDRLPHFYVSLVPFDFDEEHVGARLFGHGKGFDPGHVQAIAF